MKQAVRQPLIQRTIRNLGGRSCLDHACSARDRLPHPVHRGGGVADGLFVQQRKVIAPAVLRNRSGHNPAGAWRLKKRAVKALLPVMRCRLVVYCCQRELRPGRLLPRLVFRGNVLRGLCSAGGHRATGHDKSRPQDPPPRVTWFVVSWHFKPPSTNLTTADLTTAWCKPITTRLFCHGRSSMAWPVRSGKKPRIHSMPMARPCDYRTVNGRRLPTQDKIGRPLDGDEFIHGRLGTEPWSPEA